MVRFLAVGVSVSALAGVLAASPVLAQSAPEQGGRPIPPASEVATQSPLTAPLQSGGLEEIVVTARRREENAQKVPISITAFSGNELQQQSAVKVADVRRLTPNLFIGQAGSAPGGLVIGIRGQVQTDTITTLDPSVGIYVDGVYWARAQGANADLVDIQRIEVLKGPQGTLFGRNTTGGALNITTANPDPTAFSGSLMGRLGNYDQRDGALILNIPLVEDKVALRIAGNKINHDGFFKNTFLGTRLGSQDTYTVRAKLLVKPTDSLTILGSYEHFGLGQSGNLTRLRASSPFPAAPEVVAALSSGGCLRSFNPACPAAFVPGAQTFAQYANPTDFYSAPLNIDAHETANTDTASLTAEYDLGPATLKYIGSYRDVVANTGVYDYDGTPFLVLQPSNVAATHQWTHEAQLNGAAVDDRLNYTLGGYLFRETGTDGGSTFALPAINPNNPTNTRGAIKTRSKAVFGQATFRFTDALSFTGGLRYSSDRKGLDLSSTSAGVCALSVGTPPVRIPATGTCLVSQRRKDSAVSYLASAEYRITPDILTYAKTSKGYRAGGFNLRGTTPSTYGAFSPEKVVDYELGLKSELFDRRVRFNLAAFYSDYTNIQRGVLVANGIGGVATTTINAGKARIQGLEAELKAQVATGLQVSGTLGLIDAKYKTFLSACPIPYPTTAVVPCVNGVFDRSGETFERTPKVTWSVAGSYTHAVPLGTATIRADYSYQSLTRQVGVTQTLTPALVPFISQKGYGLLNGRLSWDIASPDLSIALYGRNLTKKKYYGYQLDLVNAGLGYIQGAPGTPRQYGIEGTFRF